MYTDPTYLGMFSGALASLFVFNLLLAKFLQDRRFLLINLVVVGFASVFIARAALGSLLNIPALRLWILASGLPLFGALATLTFLLRLLADMKESAPGCDKFMKVLTIFIGAGALALVSPIVLAGFGQAHLAQVVEAHVYAAFIVVNGVVTAGWLVALMLTPTQLGERRSITVLGTILVIGFLLIYDLSLYGYVAIDEPTVNQLRIGVAAGLGFYMLAVARQAQFVQAQRQRFDASRRDRAAASVDKQRSRDAISQAHLMNVLKREKELEAELRKREIEQMEALKAAKEAADETARNKAQFLAFMSHEIRTPLNGIMGMVRLLMNTDISEQQRDYIQTLNYSGDALLALVNDTLDISKIEAGQLVLETIDFDLQRLVSSIIMLMSARASEKGLLIRSDIGGAVPHFIKGDPTRLRQILLNLINNAIKFTEEGGVTVVARKLQGGAAGSTRLRFEVQDTGPGIPEEARGRLFQEYSQVDASTTRLYGGTGLGLSICKQLVLAMDGQIGVESLEGQGSTFWFVVDFADTTGDTLGEMPGRAPGTPSLVAMVVEDNEIHQKVIGGYLRLDGHEVTLVGSAEEALEKLMEKDFDVLLMDVNLPGIDGNEATRRIRQLHNPLKSTVPIIAITGNTSPPDIDECRASGMDDFVGKPVDPDALRATVLASHKVWLERRKTHGSAAAKGTQGEYSQLRKARALRILVVDDNEINRRVIAGFLQADGHQIEFAVTGEKALALAAAGGYDMVLMDITLPGMDGLEASRRIRRLPDSRARSVPIVAITGNTASADVQACKDAGMNDFLGKPIDPDSLEAVIDRLRGDHADPLDDYLPAQTSQTQFLDEAVLGRLSKAFEPHAVGALLADMVQESIPIIAAMNASLAEGDFIAMRAQAHTLKGMAMTLGVVAVGEISADIESSVQRAESVEVIQTMLHELHRVFEQSQAAMDGWREHNVHQLA